MQTVPIELPDKLAAMLDSVCLENGKVKQELLKELIIRYLEDIEDVADAMRAIEEGGTTISLQEMTRKYGLDD